MTLHPEVIMKKKYKKHIGISLENMTVYHPKKQLTQKDVNDLLDIFVALIEFKGYVCGGGFTLVDMNKYE